MLHLINQTNFTVECVPQYHIETGLTSVVIIKASWSFDQNGKINQAPSKPICHQDQFFGMPAFSSITQAQESSAEKNHAEILCYGKGYPPAGSEEAFQVTMRLESPRHGLWEKSLVLSGERQWRVLGGHYQKTLAKALTVIPLRYEYAFGGGRVGSVYAANPAGVGFGGDTQRTGRLLPQIEYPHSRVKSIDDNVPPAGFGPIPVSWLSQAIPEGRVSVAPVDQRFSHRFTGGECITVLGMRASNRPLVLQLPRKNPRLCLVHWGGEHSASLEADTVVVDIERHLLTMLWRKNIPSDQVYSHGLVQLEAS